MIDTAITADAEVRRLQCLGEANHDWCEHCPPTGKPPRDGSGVRSWRDRGAALLRTFSRRSPKRSAAPTTT
jgi:hypothetical protein